VPQPTTLSRALNQEKLGKINLELTSDFAVKLWLASEITDPVPFQ
jgi:hypothetical protein